MLHITSDLYRATADELRRETEGLDFFNGSVQVDSQEFHASLICTLILLRDETNTELISVLPVWWEYHFHQAGGEALTDFSWRELDAYLCGDRKP